MTITINDIDEIFIGRKKVGEIWGDTLTIFDTPKKEGRMFGISSRRVVAQIVRKHFA